MQQKLRDLMTSEHLKSGQLAEALGINPAGLRIVAENPASFSATESRLVAAR